TGARRGAPPNLLAGSGTARPARRMAGSLPRLLGKSARCPRNGNQATKEALMTQTITPYLLYEEVDAALEFLDRAFGFKEHVRLTGPEGYVNHAETRLGDAAVYLGDPGDHYQSPKRLGQETFSLYVLVEDVHAHYERAKAAGYHEMTDLPAPRRARLAERLPISTIELEHEARSRDGTVKALFRTSDGQPVEAVLMRFRDGRRTVCLSSQSGCPLTCTFCATGQMPVVRNLTASEMLDQALHIRRLETIDHVVFMGMGEPMLNVDEVIAAARRLPDL